MFYTPANHSPKMNSLVHMAGEDAFCSRFIRSSNSTI